MNGEGKATERVVFSNDQIIILSKFSTRFNQRTNLPSEEVTLASVPKMDEGVYALPDDRKRVRSSEHKILERETGLSCISMVYFALITLSNTRLPPTPYH